ncbi:uncharacterized protein LOC134820989 [Bolinopsis microptera]|uniref:uncharacterized protein LOC134820989 n=1 Tax=Bolinopsis microptera TaxID=2820187 RepID=UPI00307A6FA8
MDKFTDSLNEPFDVLPKKKLEVEAPVQVNLITPVLSDVTTSASLQAYISEDSASQHTNIDPRDEKDRDYQPASSSSSASTPRVTVSTYLNCNLDGMAAELERNSAGTESNARTLTLFCKELYKGGLLQQPYVVPRSKLESIRGRDGKKRLEALSTRSPLAIFFDGKEDKNIRMSQKDEKGHIRHSVGKRSHYSVVEQPGAIPLGMFVPEQSTGKGLALGLCNYFESRGISTDKTLCIGGDNTSVNSGYLGGAFREFEVLLHRTLQRALCLLHQVELPLRKLYFHYGGSTKAPGDFDGPMGPFIMSNELWLKPVRVFKKIGKGFPRLPQETLSKMSNDAKLMYKYCITVETGLHDEFVYNAIGNCSTARWITFGARILRFYISGDLTYNSHISECLERMVNFIVNVYYKVFANIKMKSSLIDAPAHLFDQIRFTREHCEPAERKVIFESIQQNGYMAHPESVILAMLGDHNRDHREKGIGIVKNIRRSEEWDKHVERESGVRRPRRIRHFKCPKIVFKCTTYFEMVRMKVEKENGPVPMKIFFQTYDNEWERVTCPPLLSVMSSAELEKIREAPLGPNLGLDRYVRAILLADADRHRMRQRLRTITLEADNDPF